MREHAGGGASLSRRSLLTGAAALAGAAFPARPVTAAAPLHADIAERARRIAGQRRDLTLLLPAGCRANVRPVAAAFQSLSGIELRLREVPVNEINAQMMLDAMTGTTGYDLALPATFGIPDLAASGALHPLTAYADRHEPPGFRSAALYGAGDRFDGEIFGFQTDGDAYVMFFHRDWMQDPNEQARYADRTGTPLTIPRTWSELDRQMAFFHRPDQDRFGGALFRTPGYLAWEWWLRFHAKGVWPFSVDLEPQIDSDEGTEALEEMIRATESLYPHARSAGLFENWRRFARGNVFCNIGWGGTQKYLNGPHSAMRGRLLYAATPCAEVHGKLVPIPYFNWGWNYVVTSASRAPELAYLFALFASTEDMSTLSVRAQDGFFDPFRPEHYDDTRIMDAYSPDFLKVHRASLSNAIPDLYLGHGSEYFSILNSWLDAAMNGDVRPDVALRRAAAQWSILNLRTGESVQRRRWLDLRSKYPQAVRRSLRDL